MKKLKEKFYNKVKKTNSCWNWIGYINDNGYGQMQKHGKQIRAHRLSWEIHFGKIPESLLVCHHCDNPKCVNPKHLFLGTHKDNVQDMMKKGRGKYVAHKGEEHGCSKLKKDDVLKIRELYSCGLFTQELLAEIFKVSQRNISFVTSRQHWKNC